VSNATLSGRYLLAVIGADTSSSTIYVLIIRRQRRLPKRQGDDGSACSAPGQYTCWHRAEWDEGAHDQGHDTFVVLRSRAAGRSVPDALLCLSAARAAGGTQADRVKPVRGRLGKVHCRRGFEGAAVWEFFAGEKRRQYEKSIVRCVRRSTGINQGRHNSV
jgi:hypothetical protein